MIEYYEYKYVGGFTLGELRGYAWQLGGSSLAHELEILTSEGDPVYLNRVNCNAETAVNQLWEKIKELA